MTEFLPSQRFKTCAYCRGLGKYSSLGFIEKDCLHCNGLGYFDKQAVVHDFIEKRQYIELRKPKKRPKIRERTNFIHPFDVIKDKLEKANDKE